jgi:hypothetical protein
MAWHSRNNLISDLPSKLGRLSMVADRMSPTIVDALEMIDVEQHQRERGAVASGTIHFLLQMLDQAATIGDSGQTIRGREASDTKLRSMVY